MVISLPSSKSMWFWVTTFRVSVTLSFTDLSSCISKFNGEKSCCLYICAWNLSLLCRTLSVALDMAIVWFSLIRIRAPLSYIMRQVVSKNQSKMLCDRVFGIENLNTCTGAMYLPCLFCSHPWHSFALMPFPQGN